MRSHPGPLHALVASARQCAYRGRAIDRARWRNENDVGLRSDKMIDDGTHLLQIRTLLHAPHNLLFEASHLLRCALHIALSAIAY